MIFHKFKTVGTNNSIKIVPDHIEYQRHIAIPHFDAVYILFCDSKRRFAQLHLKL